MKRNFKSILFTFIFALFLYYFMLPPLNLHSMGFWGFIILILFFYVLFRVVFDGSYIIKDIRGNWKTIKETGKSTVIILASIFVFFVITLIINFCCSPLFNSKKYSTRISVNETNDFVTDVEKVDFSKIPLLDKNSSQKLGDRKMGEQPDWVSQFYVSELYTQINYNSQIVRVTPLEYDGLIKYFTNRSEGIKGYIMVNSVNGEANLIKLDNGMRYMPSAYFFEDLQRALRIKYPTAIFGEKSFEIDENGNPYWIIPTIKYVGIEMRTEINGAILFNAVTGESQRYAVDEIPTWVDHVYSADLIIEQVDDWGTYRNGFWNSIFGQKNVVNTTDGYNYLIFGDDVYLYTGITSVVADESNLGFILVNMRTKETNFYSAAGAEEYSAMSSAEGLVQEKSYKASFPLLINLNNRPTYLMSLKDNAGLVKMYAFVDVVDYQIVSTSDASLGIEYAAKTYLTKINKETETSENIKTSKITIKNIMASIIDGNTYYYFTDEKGLKYQVSIKVDQYIIPFLTKDSVVNITYQEGNINIIKTIELV